MPRPRPTARRLRSAADRKATGSVIAPGLRRAAASRAILDHGDLVADGVEGHLVHERADQQQAASADAGEVVGLDRPIEQRGVEARSVVGDDEASGIAVELHLDADVARAIGLLGRPAFGQVVERPLVLLPQVGAELQVAVVEGIGQGLLECDADLDPAGGVAEVQAIELLADQLEQGRDQGGVALEPERRLAPDEAAEDPPPQAGQAGDVQDPAQRRGQVARRSRLGM